MIRKEDIMKKIAVIFGGMSSEHNISCISASTIIRNIDETQYETVLIGITKKGKWLLVDSLESIQDGSWRYSETGAIISPDAADHGIIITSGDTIRKERIDVIFPVLHGLWGEDGTIQGLFELSGIPYVGCGVLASACSMDKVYTKLIVDTLGIRQAQYVVIKKKDVSDMPACVARVEEKLSYPVFVKPSNEGSSCGISKAHNRKELEDALLLAVKHDRKILVEETIVGRELECAVLGGRASGVGEVVSADEFYSYDAKYNNSESKTVIGPELPAGKTEEIRRNAERIFEAVDGFGLSRVDFFLENGSNDVVFNEINTLPGFTNISMFPMLFKAVGLEIREQVKELIEMAEMRNE